MRSLPARMVEPRAPYFAGEENHAPFERALSGRVSAGTRGAIEAAWRAGDFGRAAAFTTALADVDDRRQILLPLIAEWAKAHPERAARFALTSSAGAERRELLEVAVRTWTERDIAAASAWLGALDPQPDHDAAVAAIALCETLSTERPEIALSWAESIGAPGVRWETVCTIVEGWARRDAAVALHYIETSPALSADERVRMRTYVAGRIAVVE